MHHRKCPESRRSGPTVPSARHRPRAWEAGVAKEITGRERKPETCTHRADPVARHARRTRVTTQSSRPRGTGTIGESQRGVQPAAPGGHAECDRLRTSTATIPREGRSEGQGRVKWVERNSLGEGWPLDLMDQQPPVRPSKAEQSLDRYGDGCDDARLSAVESRALGYTVGLMFWLSRKKFVGSYRVLSSTSRS